MKFSNVFRKIENSLTIENEFIVKKLPQSLSFSVVAYFTYYMIIQNFVLSESFMVLPLREIDDVAFQHSIRRLHADFSLYSMFSFNDYGYGWIFWIFISILTYPLYLLQQSSGVEWPLIVLPRMVSTFFCTASVYIFYKLISVYTKDEWIKFVAVILYPLTITAVVMGGRFHNITMGVFFCILAIYYIAKDDNLTNENLYKGLFALAFAFGIKLTNIVIAPIFIIMVLGRYNFKLDRQLFFNLFKACCISGYFCIFLIAPIFAVPFLTVTDVGSSMWHAAISAFSYGITNTGGISLPFWEIIYGQQVTILFYPVVYTFLMLLSCIMAYYFYTKSSTRKFDGIAYIVGYIVAIVFLSLKAQYVFSYSLVVTFGLPLSIIMLGKFKGTLAKLCTFLFLCGILLFQVAFLKYENKKDPLSTNIFNGYFSIDSYFETMKGSFGTIETVSNVKGIIASNIDLNEKFTVIYDYQIPNPVPKLTYNNINSFTIFDNFNKYNMPNKVFILLSTKRLNLQDSSYKFEVTKHFSDSLLNGIAQDKKFQDNLLNNNTVDGVNFILLKQTDDYYLFMKNKQQSN